MSTIAPAVMITGASTGIGAACALEFDRRGYRVFAGVRSEAAGQALQAQASARLTPVQIDVTDGGAIAAAAGSVAQAVSAAGIVGLVNNAGVAVPGPIEILPLDALRQQLEVNVIGVVAVTQAFLPLVRKAQGRVVNISSVNGAYSPPYLGAYAASKFALEALTDSLRVELRTWSIPVSLVEPGPIDTPIWSKSTQWADELAAPAAPELLALYAAEIATVRNTMERVARKAAPVRCAVEAVVHAITAKRPKTRYYLGCDVRFMSRSFRLLPDRLRDWMTRKMMGLP
jgi:NAD(P)-dependent dehydrogenase (short-subunit alcohol dehydrogenase family)